MDETQMLEMSEEEAEAILEAEMRRFARAYTALAREK